MIKINSSTMADRCNLTSLIYSQLTKDIDRIEGKLQIDWDTSNFESLELECDDIEGVLSSFEYSINSLPIVLESQETIFEANMARHPEITWKQVEERLKNAQFIKLKAILFLSDADLVGLDKESGELIFQQRSAEASFARGYAYHNRMVTIKGIAEEMGLEIMSEHDYLEAQKVDQMDKNTSCWLKTPPEKLEKNVALVGQRINDKVVISETTANEGKVNRGVRYTLYF